MPAPENEFSWPVRVYYEDTDSGGVVYYANYLKFMERARTEYLRELGFEQDKLKQEQGVLFAVHSVTVKYRKPAVFNDELTVTSKITALGRASLTFRQSVFRPSDQSVLCDAEVRIACIEADNFAPAAIPSSVLSMVKKRAV